MKRMILMIAAILFVCSLAAQTPTPQREKVAEGQYVRMHDNETIPGSTQSWTLWRTADGYVLEDHFAASNPNNNGNAFGDIQLSAQAREKMKKEANADFLEMTLNRDYGIESFVLHGKMLLDEKPADVLSCDHDGLKIRCKGLKGDSKLSSHEARPIFYAFPFPMIYAPFARAGQAQEAGKTVTTRLALIDWMGQQRLTEVEGQIQHVGIETIQIGEKSLKLHRYDVSINTSKGPVKSKIWASPGGLIVAMENADVIGERMALVQFKKYADF